MNIMILGHKEHGKTTLASILDTRFGIPFVDTTYYVKQLTHRFLTQLGTTAPISPNNFYMAYDVDKNSVREIMVEALTAYNKYDTARFIKEQFERSDIYAGCRSQEEYDAAKSVIDLTFWVEDPRKEQNDPTMKIQFDPKTMIHINNSGTVAQLERNVKEVLTYHAGIPLNTFDKTYRDALISGMKSTQQLIPTNTEEF